MSYNSRPSSTIRSQRRPIGRMNGKRASHRRQTLFCEHGKLISKCHKKNCGMAEMEDDGSATAGGAMA